MWRIKIFKYATARLFKFCTICLLFTKPNISLPPVLFVGIVPLAHVIYNVRNVIENYTSHGSTVNVCSIDLSKAFDRMNHYALYIKLMKRGFPVALHVILEKWTHLCPRSSQTCPRSSHLCHRLSHLCPPFTQICPQFSHLCPRSNLP